MLQIMRMVEVCQSVSRRPASFHILPWHQLHYIYSLHNVRSMIIEHDFFNSQNLMDVGISYYY